MMVANTYSVQAEEIDAGFVANTMTPNERTSYVAGVVEGLAVSRAIRDKSDRSGMNCIYHWYSRNSGSNEKTLKLLNLFKKHPKRPVGVLLHLLVKKECGA